MIIINIQYSVLLIEVQIIHQIIVIIIKFMKNLFVLVEFIYHSSINLYLNLKNENVLFGLFIAQITVSISYYY